jgi:hypothetical protein
MVRRRACLGDRSRGAEVTLRQCRDVLTVSMRNPAGFTTFRAAA